MAELKDKFYILTEIANYNVIKNYSNARNEATLSELLLREDDAIYAFEVGLRLDLFVKDHYYTELPLKMKKLKPGMIIDFLKKDKRWSFGKIKDLQVESYTHKVILTLEYFRNRGELTTISFTPDQSNTAPFPTESHQFAEQYHILVIQRIYNEITREMEVCNLPLITTLAGWMRMKEIQMLIYQHVRAYIADPFKFKVDNSKDLYSIEENVINEGKSKAGKMEKMKKFR